MRFIRKEKKALWRKTRPLGMISRVRSCFCSFETWQFFFWKSQQVWCLHRRCWVEDKKQVLTMFPKWSDGCCPFSRENIFFWAFTSGRSQQVFKSGPCRRLTPLARVRVSKAVEVGRQLRPSQMGQIIEGQPNRPNKWGPTIWAK